MAGDVTRMFDEAADALGPADVLVNNAGACIHRPALEVPDEEWDSVLDLNLTALWRCCREVPSTHRRIEA